MSENNGNPQQTKTQQRGPAGAPMRESAQIQKPPAGGGGGGKPPPGKDEVDLRAFLEKNKTRIAEVASKHLNADRIVRLAALAIHKDKSGQLARSSPISILQSVMEASRLGLEIGGALGHAYLVAYKNKDTVEAQLQVGYRGLIELAMRTNKVASVQAHIVWESDDFDYTEGDDPRIFHKPNLDDPRVKWRFVYCIIKLVNGGVLRDVLTHAQVMKIKGRSKSAGSSYSPWNTDEPEMARKTAARRTIKYAPMSSELADALDHDDQDFVETSVIDRQEIPRPTGQKGLKALVDKNVAPEQPEEPPPHGDEQPEETAVPHDEKTGEVLEPGAEGEPPETPAEDHDAFERGFKK